MSYPQYRSYSNGKGFFKVISSEEFQEIQVVGKHMVSSNYRAKNFSDRTFIQDLINCHEGRWLEIEASLYEKKLAQCK